MNETVTVVKDEMKKLNSTPHNDHIKTGDIRKLSAKLFRSIDDKSKGYVLRSAMSS